MNELSLFKTVNLRWFISQLIQLFEHQRQGNATGLNFILDYLLNLDHFLVNFYFYVVTKIRRTYWNI